MPVRLIHDPYGLFKGGAARVQSARQLPKAFRDIDALLAASERGTQEVVVYIIDSVVWTHFFSYRQMAGVRVEEYLPRVRVAQRFGSQPPDWLTDDIIFRTELLECQFDKLVDGKWDETLVEWVLPGGRAAKTLADWMRMACEAPRLDDPRLPDRVKQLLWAQFAALAQETLSLHELDAVYMLWSGYGTPLDFFRDALLAPALKPFQTTDSESSFSGHQQVPNAGRLDSLPLVFPLPRDMHKRVSDQFAAAVRRARLEKRELTTTVLLLNAVWDGLVDELRRWLNACPNALTDQAAEHLESLPGCDAAVSALLSRFRPREKPMEWDSLDGVEDWIVGYSAYIHSAFCRRALPESWIADPAAGFSQWIAQNITVPFNHNEYGFSCVARQVKECLAQGRAVILVLVDAMAFHVVDILIAEMSTALAEQPSSVHPMFVPVPTLSEVSKASVLTGLRPDQSTDRLEVLLSRVYQLDPQQVLLVDSWNDPSRAVLETSHRLVVYRENSLDDRLKDIRSYTELLDEFARISRRVAERVGNWLKDFRYLTHTDPVVIVTGDHGFTYGPPPDPQGQTAASLGGHYRCVAIDDDKATAHPQGSVVHLKREVFHLDKSYVAATSRTFRHGTVSGWVLQHGGLLPEEVIVPIVTWFSGEGYVAHPAVRIVDGALRHVGAWEITVEIQNESPGSISGIHISISMVGGGPEWSKAIPTLSPRQRIVAKVTLAGPDIPESQRLSLRVCTRVVDRSGRPSEPKVLDFLISRKAQLVERTIGQDRFENMFSS